MRHIVEFFIEIIPLSDIISPPFWFWFAIKLENFQELARNNNPRYIPRSIP